MEGLVNKVADLSIQKKLIILDLNGLLISREYVKDRTKKPPKNAKRAGNFFVYFRPGLNEFLTVIFKRYDVAVWSSACKHNVDMLCKLVFKERIDQLVFIWYQNQCTKEEHPDKKMKNIKPLYCKDLKKVRFKYVNYLHILMLDDSKHKMKLNSKDDYYVCKTWKGGDGTLLCKTRMMKRINKF